MSTRPTDPTCSLFARRIVYGVATICGINYLIRLFSISFLGIFRLYPDSWRQMVVDEAVFLEVLAWLELGMITALILIIALLCLVFIFLREIVNFMNGGWSSVTISATAFRFMLGMLLMVALLLATVASGPDALRGTRAAVLGLPIMMFVLTLLTAAIAAMVFACVVDPRGVQAASDQAHQRCKGQRPS